MKKTILILKIAMLFITAIWGLLSGIFTPLTILSDPFGDFAELGVPVYIPVMWLVTSVAGFIAPCFLVMLKIHKVAAGLGGAGFVALLVMHFSLIDYAVNDIAWLYLPLLLQTVTVVLIAVFANMSEIRIKRFEKKKSKEAPAPSILGGTYYGKTGKANNPKEKSKAKTKNNSPKKSKKSNKKR
ncbi:MAG: hypothetical protein FWG83_02545 [Oscillospiraceae bacterium]|nr:hypothetical protein [Oscillospiraceae bacterium]